MKRSYLVLVLLLNILLVNAQLPSEEVIKTDSIFKLDGNILPVNVIEITDKNIKYKYPNEELVNSITKSLVYSIKFKSGRVEEFSSVLNLTNIKSGLDWEKVQITNVPSEIEGMFRISEVNVKAKGHASMGKLESRAFNKTKMQVAMLGGNTCFMLDKYNDGNGGARGGGFVSYSAVAYTSKKVFLREISFGNYKVDRVIVLKTNNHIITDANTNVKSVSIKRDDIYSNNNFLYINGSFIKDIDKYTIIYASENFIVLSGVITTWKGKETYYNILLSKIK